MNLIRRNHLAIAGLLFALALLLYGVGNETGAIVVFALGAMLELVAWVTLLTDTSEGSFPGGKS